MTGAEDFAFAMLDDNGNYAQYGLTKREYYAGVAMQGLISAEADRKPENYASDAVACADALISALNKQP